jgi:hypothetical protein
MALYLEANYSKKLGLPGYSSHQYSLSVKTELSDPAQIQAESTRLYSLLQACVDREIQNTGYLPVNNANLNDPNGHAQPVNGNANGTGNGSDTWACSKKQQALILKIVQENNLDKNQVEAVAQERFGKSVRALNKIQASGLIDELRLQAGGCLRPRFEGGATTGTRP